MTILKKTDLAEIRNANMRIVKNKESESVDIARASRIVIQLKQLELKMLGKTDVGIHTRATHDGHGELVEGLVETFWQLRIVG